LYTHRYTWFPLSSTSSSTVFLPWGSSTSTLTSPTPAPVKSRALPKFAFPSQKTHCWPAQYASRWGQRGTWEGHLWVAGVIVDHFFLHIF
jgi:hypothetical protein